MSGFRLFPKGGSVTYSIGELARLAGVSVRTLHHYDRIGLLEPRQRTAGGYRVYGEEDLLRLQQVLFFRELEFPLEDIRDMLDRPGFDPVKALEGHRRLLEEKAARIGRLLATIDRTIARAGGEDSMLTDQELYEGFDTKDIDAMKAEAKARWGHSDPYKESQKRVAKMSKEDWARVKAEVSAVELEIAAAYKAGIAPESPEAMRLMAKKAEQLRHFYEPTPELFRGLGEMYVADGRFTATYEKMAPGLAAWLKPAMAAFADKGLKL
jgi:DNA-binding transcriptional MerR regulator